ncbi:MAG TPA: SDR family oxidoreductase [Pusillimonas sp.]|uniref:SDR family oxidoreductase n=1 Tax=unclassified Pusillimonas TaxID=2640016 RepID=UPI00261A526E|nr:MULTISPECIES: SDR family oxidoreductase [unclassified Pusillimonas]HLU19754.1 SDR family oxidoreductase [Pusillimonas sp.]
MTDSRPLVDLTGKTAIITGSTQGLGADIARVLARCGAAVTIVGRNADKGNELVESLHIQGAKALYSCTDIQQDEDIDACLRKTLETFGRLDILVNNACIYEDAGLASTREQWHHTLGVNLISAAIFTQKACALMKPGSVVINLGSTGGKFGAAGRALYPASKAAMLQFTKNLAVTLAPDGIRAVAVSPAWTWSPSVERLSQGSRPDADRVGAALHPLGRVGHGSEIGNAVAFLASDAASWITGVDIPVDGGFSILGPDQGQPPRLWFERILKQQN